MVTFSCPDDQSEYQLPIEIDILDTHRILVVPIHGLPQKGHTVLRLHSPPPCDCVYYSASANTAYFYSHTDRVFTNPNFDQPPAAGKLSE